MPLTWWLQADVHFNEEDQYQQNLVLTLQAMAENEEEKDYQIKNLQIHKEIEPELNVIFNTQIDAWISLGLSKMTIFSTGKGDIFLRILFRTCATTFNVAMLEGKKLKMKIEQSMYETFGGCLSIDFIKVACVAVQGFEMPTINVNVGKPLVLLIATQDESSFREFNVPYLKDWWYRPVNTESPPYSLEDEDEEFCTPLSAFDADFDPAKIQDLDVLELFE